jgi:hypothetical protein
MTRQGTPPSGLTRGREGLGDDFLRFCRARNLDSTFAIKIQNCRPRSGFIIEQFGRPYDRLRARTAFAKPRAPVEHKE